VSGGDAVVGEKPVNVTAVGGCESRQEPSQVIDPLTSSACINEWMPAACSRLGIRSSAITYTDPAQAILIYFFTLFSMSYMWVVRPERFELPTSWFVARRAAEIVNSVISKFLFLFNLARGMSVANSP
jgi:hypothetical protein